MGGDYFDGTCINPLNFDIVACSPGLFSTLSSHDRNRATLTVCDISGWRTRTVTFVAGPSTTSANPHRPNSASSSIPYAQVVAVRAGVEVCGSGVVATWNSYLSLNTLAETPARQISRPFRSSNTTVGIRSADGLNIPTMLFFPSIKTKLWALISCCGVPA